MMTRTSFSFVFALALVGCGDNITSDENPGTDDPSGGDPDGQHVIDATGTYRIHSTFDIASTMPGAQGAFVNGLIAATDDPDDPMSWVLDQMIDTLEPGTFKSILQGAKPLVAGYLNDQVTQLAPELFGTLIDVGQRMADLTQQFGVNEKLYVVTNDSRYVGHVVVDGVRFVVDGSYVDAQFVDHDLDDVTAEGIGISYENAHLGIADHALPLPYGKLVRIGLDVAIIPAIDPSATNLTQLLDHVVDCQGVGQSVADALDLGSAAFWSSVCVAGLDRAADAIYDQIVDSDSSLDFHLLGQARAADTDGDDKLDKLTFGEWSGELSYDGTAAALAQPATFDGERM